jgi:hypothetical protein
LSHTFATRLKYADGADSVLDEPLGHKVEKLSVGRYGKRYPVEKEGRCGEAGCEAASLTVRR